MSKSYIIFLHNNDDNNNDDENKDDLVITIARLFSQKRQAKNRQIFGIVSVVKQSPAKIFRKDNM